MRPKPLFLSLPSLVAVAFLLGALGLDSSPADALSNVPSETRSRKISSPKSASVFVLADVRLHREGLAEALQRYSHVDVVGTGSHVGEVVTAIQRLVPDIVVVDLPLPEALDEVRAIAALCPATKVLALAVREREEDIIAWAEAGIAGFVERSGSIHDLLAMIHSAGRGEMSCSPRAAAILLADVGRLASHGLSREQPHLTRRELEVVRLVEKGYTNDEIAKSLCIAVSTVKNHIHNILEKLNVHHRTEVRLRPGARMPSVIDSHVT